MSDQTPEPGPPSYPGPSDPAFGQPPFGQPAGVQPPPNPYVQNAYGQPAAQSPYGQPYGYPTYAAPNHPKATTALVLGLISTVGAFMCLLPAAVGPFAWVIGVKARREIRDSQGRFGGQGMATAGMVLGIIGTVLLALFIALVVGLIVWVISDPNAFDNGRTV